MTHAIEWERCIENLTVLLQYSQWDIELAREKLGHERLDRIQVENDLKKAIKDATGRPWLTL